MAEKFTLKKHMENMRKILTPVVRPNIVPSLLDRLGKRGTQLPRLPKQPRMPKV